jgi:5'-nucleotidase
VKKARVLLTNDDGYQAAGLKALAEELRAIAHVSIVAPSWSAAGRRRA